MELLHSDSIITRCSYNNLYISYKCTNDISITFVLSILALYKGEEKEFPDLWVVVASHQGREEKLGPNVN